MSAAEGIRPGLFMDGEVSLATGRTAISLKGRGPLVTIEMLPADLGTDSLMGAGRDMASASSSSEAAATTAVTAAPLDTTPTGGPVLPMAEVERNAILHAIDTCGSAAKAARRGSLEGLSGGSLGAAAAPGPDRRLRPDDPRAVGDRDLSRSGGRPRPRPPKTRRFHVAVGT